MAALNRVQLIGNLGREPEMRYTRQGKPVAKLSVGITERWTDRESGDKRENTTWVRVTVWGKLAENCDRYLTKGRQVFVEGKLRFGSYEKDGITRYTTDVVASDVQFLGKKTENPNAGQTSIPTDDEAPPDDDHWPGDDDIPF